MITFGKGPFFGKNVTVVDEGVTLVNAGRLYEERTDVSYDDVPDFPSWRVESAEQRAKWNLPPLTKKASISCGTKTDKERK